MPADREDLLDVVLYGATGFVGRLTAEHLAQHAGGARIGLAGRSRDKLAALQAELGAAAQDWELIVADAGDPASLAAMAAATKVVATTVGPYGKYDRGLAQACAQAGTDYCDLTGEVPFIRGSIDRSHDTAVASGARIVHACGFDSIPSDLGVLLLHERVKADGEGELEETTLLVESFKGGISGGTIDSMRTVIDEIKSDAATRKLVLDPYSLSPDRSAEPDLGERDGLGLGRSSELGGRWTAPFIMATFNTRVVRRSNALQDWAYGPELPLQRGHGRRTLAARAGPGRRHRARHRRARARHGAAADPLPARPGAAVARPGPQPEHQGQRHFRIRVHARTSTGARYDSVVAATGDPGTPRPPSCSGRAPCAWPWTASGSRPAAASSRRPRRWAPCWPTGCAPRASPWRCPGPDRDSSRRHRGDVDAVGEDTSLALRCRLHEKVPECRGSRGTTVG
jgi:short subunit dehydrogenase-like uncharacterized protein